MIWERLNDLACAVVAEKSAVEFSLNKSGSSWWLFVHEKTPDGDRLQLAWEANESLSNAVHAVEKQLEERARKLLEESTTAHRKLSAVLNEGEGTK